MVTFLQGDAAELDAESCWCGAVLFDGQPDCRRAVVPRADAEPDGPGRPLPARRAGCWPTRARAPRMKPGSTRSARNVAGGIPRRGARPPSFKKF